eukprot:212769_1
MSFLAVATFLLLTSASNIVDITCDSATTGVYTDNSGSITFRIDKTDAESVHINISSTFRITSLTATDKINTNQSWPSFTTDPNSFVTQCDRNIPGPITISQGQNVTTISDDYHMELSFYFKLTDECTLDWCNILQIGDKYDIASLYIAGNHTIHTPITIQKSIDYALGNYPFKNDATEHFLLWYFNATTHEIYIDDAYMGFARNPKRIVTAPHPLFFSDTSTAHAPMIVRDICVQWNHQRATWNNYWMVLQNISANDIVFVTATGTSSIVNTYIVNVTCDASRGEKPSVFLAVFLSISGVLCTIFACLALVSLIPFIFLLLFGKITTATVWKSHHAIESYLEEKDIGEHAWHTNPSGSFTMRERTNYFLSYRYNVLMFGKQYTAARENVKVEREVFLRNRDAGSTIPIKYVNCPISCSVSPASHRCGLSNIWRGIHFISFIGFGGFAYFFMYWNMITVSRLLARQHVVILVVIYFVVILYAVTHRTVYKGVKGLCPTGSVDCFCVRNGDDGTNEAPTNSPNIRYNHDEELQLTIKEKRQTKRQKGGQLEDESLKDTMDRLMQCNDEGKPQLTMEEKILQKKRQTKRRKGGQSVIESQNIHDDEERQLTTKSGQSVDLSQGTRTHDNVISPHHWIVGSGPMDASTTGA